MVLGRGISRNTKYYSNPCVFDPERYLGSQPELDPREFAFGYGDRRCPGNELAFQVIWVVAASVLWAFRLERVDGDTTPLEKDSDWFNIDTMWSVTDCFSVELWNDEGANSGDFKYSCGLQMSIYSKTLNPTGETEPFCILGAAESQSHFRHYIENVRLS